MDTTYSKFTVLLIDDDDVYRQYLKLSIETTFNSNVLEVSTPKHALAVLEKEIPSLIILDLELPQMDGYSFLRLIRMKPVTSQIPVIICSALKKKELIMEIAKWNISDYIIKGIDRKELTMKIKAVLDKLLI